MVLGRLIANPDLGPHVTLFGCRMHAAGAVRRGRTVSEERVRVRDLLF